MGWSEDTPQSKERQFRSILNLGNGQRSVRIQDVLMRRVETAFVALGACQQPSHPTSQEEYEEDETTRAGLQQFIEGVVEDLAVALTGKEWMPIPYTPVEKENMGLLCTSCNRIVMYCTSDGKCGNCGEQLLD